MSSLVMGMLVALQFKAWESADAQAAMTIARSAEVADEG